MRNERRSHTRGFYIEIELKKKNCLWNALWKVFINNVQSGFDAQLCSLKKVKISHGFFIQFFFLVKRRTFKESLLKISMCSSWYMQHVRWVEKSKGYEWWNYEDFFNFLLHHSSSNKMFEYLPHKISSFITFFIFHEQS